MPRLYALLLLARALHGLTAMAAAESRLERLRAAEADARAEWAAGCRAVDGLAAGARRA